MFSKRIAIISCVAVITTGSCQETDTAEAFWTEVLERCVAGDQIGDDVLYLGPSNNVGAGSIWRRMPGDGYRIVWRASDVLGATDSEETSLLNYGSSVDCSGQSLTTRNIEASTIVESQAAPISAEMRADFNNAESVTASVGLWRWVDVVTGPYSLAVQDLGSHPIRNNLNQGDHYVMGRAVEVQGVVVELQFGASNAAAMRAKYDGLLPQLGTVDAGFVASWSGDSQRTLRLTSTSTFYVAGELYGYDEEGFASSEFLRMISLPEDARVLPAN